MVTAPKRPRAPAAKPPAPPAPKPRAKPKPFLRFYLSEALHRETLEVLATLEKSQDPIRHRDELADAVVALTSAGMDYYFIRSLKLAKAGFITEQSANLGMAGAMQVLGSVLRNVIGRMEGPQLLSVAGSIHELMR